MVCVSTISGEDSQTDPSPRGYVLEKSVAFIGVTMGWTSAEVRAK